MNIYIRSAELPLAVYREVAAHLSLIEGVQTQLIAQQSSHFHYTQSQIDSLKIYYPDDLPAPAIQRIQQILTYYSDRYGNWETIN